MSHRIMIVEDDPVIAGSMSKFIAGWGHECTLRKISGILCRNSKRLGPS